VERAELITDSVTSAMKKYARAHSVGLLFTLGPRHIEIGSGTCILIGGKFLITTASHNLNDISHVHQVQIVPPSRGVTGAAPIRGWSTWRDEARDVAWLESVSPLWKCWA